MRLGAQAKLGFYPIPPKVVEYLLKHLVMPEQEDKKKRVNILDPCAGEGEALNQIATGLGIVPSNVYAVELASNRAEKIKALMPEANVLAPAGYMSVFVSTNSLSLAYVNPPFDDEFGGGRREEEAFVGRALAQVKPGGVVVIVVPVHQVVGNRAMCNLIDTRCEDIGIYRFPKDLRKFQEIIVIARKRKVELTIDLVYTKGELTRRQFHTSWDRDGIGNKLPVIGCMTRMMPADDEVPAGEDLPREWISLKQWEVPPGLKLVFQKVGFTEDEFSEAIGNSPLNKMFGDTKQVALKRPPLPPGRGHRGMLVASGMLDGVIRPEGEPAHVLRGTCRKEAYISDQSSTEGKSGAVTTKTVYSQRPVTIFRAIDSTGKIFTWSDSYGEKASQFDSNPTDADEDKVDANVFDLGDAKDDDPRAVAIRKIKGLVAKLSEDAGTTDSEKHLARRLIKTLMVKYAIKVSEFTIPSDVTIDEDVKEETAA